MKTRLVLGLAALLLLPLGSAQAGVILFGTIPANGILTGAPGTTVGYGYTLENQDPTLWLMTTNLSAGSFSFATGTSLFDFPILAPGQSVTVPYDPTNAFGLFGLYEILIDAASPVPFSNFGAFVLSGDYYDGDPFNGGQFDSAAQDQIVEYQVTAIARSTPGVPEPGVLWLTAAGLAALLILRAHSRSILGKCTALSTVSPWLRLRSRSPRKPIRFRS